MNKRMDNLLNKAITLLPEKYYSVVDSYLENKEKRIIITANPEIVMMAYRNKDLESLYLQDTTDVIPDGIGVVKAIQFKKKAKCERNTGIELVQHLLAVANERKLKVFLYGSKQDVLLDFVKYINKQYPNVIISDYYNGYDYDCDEVKEKIIKSKANIILIALGAPKQELFIRSFIDGIKFGVCVGVGGTFDVLSGHTKRAPEFFIKHNIEWLYRISGDFKRIKRFVYNNCSFIAKVLF